jgi:hypothetical protein
VVAVVLLQPFRVGRRPHRLSSRRTSLEAAGEIALTLPFPSCQNSARSSRGELRSCRDNVADELCAQIGVVESSVKLSCARVDGG